MNRALQGAIPRTAGSEGPRSADGRTRAVIDAVLPCVDRGRFAPKCIAGEPLQIEAHCFTDGHDRLRVMLQWCAEDGGSGAAGAEHAALTDAPPAPGQAAPTVHELEMQLRHNDEWLASFAPPAPGRYGYAVVAWVDHFRSWREDLRRRIDPDDIRVNVLAGAELLDAAAARANGADRLALRDWAAQLHREARAAGNMHGGDATAPTQATAAGTAAALKALALDDELAELADRYPDRSLAVRLPPDPAWLPLVADRPLARFSAWYEMFPRSAAGESGRHGTFADVEARLPYVAGMGFDVLYLPPIHPIGREKRKGRNNALAAEPGDVGSPWAIGSTEGGHKAVHPDLGTLDDFRRLVARAREHGLEVALDIAFQCAPDHPYVREHPQWFRWRPDGSVQYAENPPKKYQDIYPFDFESEDWRALWQELRSVFEHWIAQGVSVFRVDNPHTKSFAFWEWCIRDVKRAHPEVIFLSEAFTRPKLMHRLAKLGYTQSYTYFTWRHTRQELTDYFTELAHGPGAAYFRPNAWPNTPDILGDHLHDAGRPMFALRLALAALLCSSYGIYGPAYELMENRPRSPDGEEYLDSEKYQLRHWDVDRPDSLRELIARLNRIRRAHPALQRNDTLRFMPVDNEQLLAFVKSAPDTGAGPAGQDMVLCVVNLDARFRQSGWIQLDLAAWGIEPDAEYPLHDELNDAHYTWRGPRNFVILDPAATPAHVFRVATRAHREQDVDHFA